MRDLRQRPAHIQISVRKYEIRFFWMEILSFFGCVTAVRRRFGDNFIWNGWRVILGAVGNTFAGKFVTLVLAGHRHLSF